MGCNFSSNIKQTNLFCKKCLLKYKKSSDIKHCCDCKKTMDVNKNHCDICYSTYDINKKHCYTCNQSYNISLIHCSKCHSSYDINDVHCCDCQINYNSFIEKHCCKCRKKWKKVNQTHCLICHSLYYKNDKHCCDCQINYKEFEEKHCCRCKIKWINFNQTHCSICHFIYDKRLSHCCNCNMLYNKNYIIHCCSCKMKYGYGKNHCCNCKINYDKNMTHCCNCKMNCGYNENHCCNCKINYDKNTTHCCSCKMNYGYNENHCCNCKMNYKHGKNHCCNCKMNHGHGKNHCCNCKINYDKNTTHCCSCKMNYGYNENHCCGCKINYDKNKEFHCCKCDVVCHMTYKIEEKCRCKCMINYDDSSQIHCNINEHNTYISNILKIINKNNLYKTRLSENTHVVSDCIFTNCNSTLKFKKGIENLNLNFKTLSENDDAWLMVFHGTPTSIYADNICCNGMLINKRGVNGQKHGPGEYFTTNINTAKRYTRGTGALLYCLMINPKYCNDIKIHNYSNTETWYIVNNKENAHYYLPIFILKNIVNIDKYKFCLANKNKNIMQKIKDNKISISLYYIDNDNKATIYNKNDMEIIYRSIQLNIYEFNILINNAPYNINLNYMTQTNLNTNKTRTILFEQ
jgi:hypothetical protein